MTGNQNSINLRERSNERKVGDDMIDTSSFAEDISFHQTKPVEVQNIEVTSQRRGERLAKLQKSLGNDDRAKLSETGLKELSIVESDNHASG